LNSLSCTIQNPQQYRTISLENGNEEINNLKLMTCDGKEFLVTVDFGGYVRMFFMEDLLKDPIKFHNVYPTKDDNSTWSLTSS